MISSLPQTGRRAFLLGSAATALAWPFRRATAVPMSGLKGLEAPVSIQEDRWGVPHVRAASIADAFFANGYLIARDRLWQLDFGYRQSIGRLAAVFGDAFIASDVANRLFLYRGDPDQELARYSPDVRAAATSYVAGINAFIESLGQNPGSVAPEFDILGYAPLRWSVSDLIRMRAEVTGNTALEIRRAELAARGALSYDGLVTPLDPPIPLRVPEGLDVQAISRADLGHLGVLQKRLPLGQIHAATLHGDMTHRKANEGSNSWVIAPQRTATGRPILANDPHLGFGAPGPRHVLHLTAPGLDVIGAGTPGMPGIMQGHNADIAFGRTNFHIDQEDLFVLRTNPHDPTQYWHQGQWAQMEGETVRVGVRDRADHVETLYYAAQGPVISHDHARDRAVAMSATWLAPGANGLLANIGINMATDWNSFREALRHHTSPTNFTYADRKGNIGWQAAGGLPLRADNHDGLMPAPGDGSCDWQGLQPLENLPHVFNPSIGWFSNSNEMNLPPDYDQKTHKVSHEWTSPFRHERVSQMLDATPHATLRDSVALQHDTLSVLALQIVNLLPDHAPEHLKAAQAMLKAWDGRVNADSAAAALYEVWWTTLSTALYRCHIPESLRDLLAAPLDPMVQLSLLQNPGPAFGENAAEGRDRLLLESLEAAISELTRSQGPLPAAWRWGKLHTVTLRHSLENISSISHTFPPIGGPDYGSGGDHYTVMARWYDPEKTHGNPYATTGGASYLMVCDVGAWDNSLFLNFPGQSGSLQSAHYQDFFTPWMAGEMQPFPFSKHAVDAATRTHTVLHP